ncbi:MAG: GNAT family N-acetyltransferase [Acidobacteriota bacterium]
MKTLIRRARPDEADRLTEIAFASKRHWSYPEAWLEAWRESLTLTPDFVGSNVVDVAVDGEDVAIACSALVDEKGASSAIQLEHFWVEPAAIGRGVGRMLFQHVVETARGLDGESLLIESDPNAEAFYERMGAVRVGWVRADVCGTPRRLPTMRFDLRVA